MTSANSQKFKLYLDFETSIRGVLLPVNITYLQLITYLTNKYQIKDKIISLYYMSASTKIHVSDDDDVSFFVHEICCKQHLIQTLYIKLIEKSSEVKPPTSSKTLDIDLNVPLLPQESDFQTPKVEDHNNEGAGANVNVDVHPSWQKTTFLNIPDPPSSADPIIKKVSNHKHPVVSKLKVGSRFDDKQGCIYAIGIKALVDMFEYKVTNSCKKRYSVACFVEGCNWYINARKSVVSRYFYVTSINDSHTCSRTKIHPNHRNATRKLLGHILVDKLRNCKRVYTGADIKNDFNVDWKVDISYYRAWGGKNIALQLLNGCPRESFEQLPYYCYNLKLENEGTVTHIETDETDRFKMVFIGFGVAVSFS